MTTTTSKYPETITPAMLPTWAAISDTEITRDIGETEQEIARLREMLKCERSIAESHLSSAERKMADFKASARPGQIAEREAFVVFLERLRAARLSASAPAAAAEAEQP